MISRLLWAVAACSLAIASPAFAQNIDTRAAATASLASCCYGPGMPNSVGQTFTVPMGQAGVSSFSIRSQAIPATSTFRGVLMQWNTGTNRAIGPVLYQSADVNTTGLNQEVSFTIPGSVPVTAGQTYVIFLSGVNSAGSGGGPLWATPGDSLAGGAAVAQSAPSQTDWTGTGWAVFAGNDFGVTVNFVAAAPVPTLSEWAMILFGLVLAGGAALYIQRRQMTA